MLISHSTPRIKVAYKDVHLFLPRGYTKRQLTASQKCADAHQRLYDYNNSAEVANWNNETPARQEQITAKAIRLEKAHEKTQHALNIALYGCTWN
ncbi:MAG: hypothetical protein ACR2PR_09000 [Pseudohongiellaceae bacterium]